jgi:hypothetical protein
VTPIPREAREGLMRAWLSVLADRHPEVLWVPATQEPPEEPRAGGEDEATLIAA